jgi:hypothetical protein
MLIAEGEDIYSLMQKFVRVPPSAPYTGARLCARYPRYPYTGARRCIGL